MLTLLLRTALVVSLILAISPCLAAKVASYEQGGQVIDACQLDLTQDSVRMFWRTSDGSVFGNFAHLAEWLLERHEKLICATNGGIYGKDLRPIGLYVEEGKIIRKLNTRKAAYGNFYLQPNGIFLLSNKEAAILSTDELASEFDQRLRSTRFATQSGPILLSNGQINPLFTPGSDNRVVRNAVCLVTATRIALVKSHTPINFYDFARLLRDLLGCRDALYMDGSISQLYPYDDGRLGPSYATIIGATAPAGQ